MADAPKTYECNVCRHPLTSPEATTCTYCNSAVHLACGKKRTELKFPAGKTTLHPVIKFMCDKCRLQKLEDKPTSDPELKQQMKLLDDAVRKVGSETSDIAQRVSALEAEPRGSTRVARHEKPNWLYPIIFCAAILTVAALVASKWANTPDVSIDFNVGEIIGGLLVGIGAIWAAIAYGAKGRSGAD